MVDSITAIRKHSFSTLPLSFRDGPEDQTRNLEIPGSLASLAPRNDGSTLDPKNPPRFRRARNLAAGAARARRDALDQLAVRCYLGAVGLIEGVFKPGAQVAAQISAALMQRPDFRPPDRRDLPMGFRRFQLQEDRQQFRIGRHARGDAHY